MRKVRKIPNVCFSKKIKNLILDLFWPFRPKRPKTRFSPKKIVKLNNITLSCCNLLKKKHENSTGRKTWKTSIQVHFRLFWLRNPRIRFFSKTESPSLFKLNDTLTSCNKSENFYKQFRRKTTDKQTDGQT